MQNPDFGGDDVALGSLLHLSPPLPPFVWAGGLHNIHLSVPSLICLLKLFLYSVVF